jgi:excisionase family DNA binding protein
LRGNGGRRARGWGQLVVGPTIKEDTMNETGRERRRFCRVKEAAAIMGVPLWTMYHLAETGQIPCRRLGTVILVPVAWVEREPLAPAKR